MRTLILSAILLFTSPIFSQQVQIGITGGANYSYYKWNDDYYNFTELYHQKTHLTSYNLGFNFIYHFNHRWSIETQLKYSREGEVTQTLYFKNNSYTDSYYKTLEDNGYLRMPIFMRYKITGSQAPIGLSVYSGINNGILLKSNVEMIGDDEIAQELINTNQLYNYDITTFKQKDFGVNVGMNLTREITKDISANLDLGWYYGLQNIAITDYTFTCIVNSKHNKHFYGNI